eukprot:4495821-Pyramimonas_sp.AAC.1
MQSTGLFSSLSNDHKRGVQVPRSTAIFKQSLYKWATFLALISKSHGLVDSSPLATSALSAQICNGLDLPSRRG